MEQPTQILNAVEDSSPCVMNTLVLCGDVQFLGATTALLRQLKATPHVVGNSAAAETVLDQHKFEAILVDWREIDIPEFLCKIRSSKRNHEAVLIAIVRDLLDLKQAFAAGVQLLIHKPASSLQIERCLRAAYAASVTRRRKQHREPVNLPASIRTRSNPSVGATVTNVSERGACVEIEGGAYNLSVGCAVDLHFLLPGGHEAFVCAATVVWRSDERVGMRFTYVPEPARLSLEQWLTTCVQRSMAELSERLSALCA